ncbi:MAG: PAS domain-containing protein [Planctomycetes bacterium]|nr:PAS domain-containing protein [Planctomycetota bacterium]
MAKNAPHVAPCCLEVSDSVKKPESSLEEPLTPAEEITGLRRELEGLRKKYCDFFDLAPVGLLTLDKDMTILSANQMSGQLLFVDRTRLIGRNFAEFVSANDRRKFVLNFDEFLRTWRRQSCELRIKRADSADFWARATLVPKLGGKKAGGHIRLVVVDITQQRKAEVEARRQGDFLRTVIESLPHPFYVINVDDFTIAMANSAAYGADTLNPEITCYALTHHKENPCDCLQYPCPIKIIRETHKPATVEHVHYDKNGDAKVFEVHGYPIFDESGRLKQVIEYNFDITARKHAELERERLMTTLEAKNKELQSIVYVASHDLKSPLINIKGFADELTQHCRKLQEICRKSITDEVKDETTQLLDESIPQALEFINAGTGKINVLINGLLEVSRLGAAEMHIEHLDMDKLMHDVVEGLRFEANKRRVSITVDRLPACMGDRAGTNQIFTNLLNNAIKYLHARRKGRISVTGRVENGNSVYRVQDNGIGIAPQYCDRIFEIFHRLEPRNGVDGEGLGLTIVGRILDRQQGSIRVESESGKGSRFFVSLPAA